MTLVWTITDARGWIAGPFYPLAQAEHFIKISKPEDLIPPLTLMQVENGVKGRIGDVLSERFRGLADRIQAEIAAEKVEGT